MNVLLVQSMLYVPARNGANRSNRAILEALADRGCRCAAVTPAFVPHGPPTPEAYQEELLRLGLPSRQRGHALVYTSRAVEVAACLNPHGLPALLRQRIDEFQPDWILVASEDPGQVLLEAALQARPGRVICLARTTMNLPFGPDAALPNPNGAGLLRRAAGILTCSQFLCDYVRQWGGLDAQVLRAPVYGAGPFPALGNFDRGYVTLINPCATKGIAIFLALARALPEVAFAAVPTTGATADDLAALHALPNVRLLPASEDIDDIFKETRILLVPSLWAEAFGRVSVEAMLRGIPVLASKLGGLIEAKLGVEGLLPVRPIERYEARLDDRKYPVAQVPEQDIGPWRQALEELLSDRAKYDRLAQESRAAALKYVANLNLTPLEAILFQAHANGPVETPAPAAAPVDVAQRLEGLSPERRALVARLLQAKKAAAPPAIARRSDPGPAPLSFTQQRFWFLWKLDPSSAAHNVPATLRVNGSFSHGLLEAALNEMLRRHEALRTIFRETEAGPRQETVGYQPQSLPLMDLRSLAEPDREGRAQQQAAEWLQQPFDLEAPPWRAVLFRLADDAQIVFLSLHHIIADGWSIRLFWREFSVVCKALLSGQPIPLSPPLLTYADYAAWERQNADVDRAGHLAYWKKHLSGIPPLELPTDYARPAARTYRGQVRSFLVPDRLVEGLKDLGQQEGATLFMTLLAAFQILLSRYSAQTDISIGTAVAGRHRAELEAIFGCFLNTLVLRGDLSGNPSFRDLLQRVRQTAREGFAHQDVPFEELLGALQPERRLDAAPFFQALFVLENAPWHALDLPGLIVQPAWVHNGCSPFDLALSLVESAAGLQGSLEFSSDLFRAETIDRLIGHFLTLLAGIVAEPGARLSQLPLLSPAEKRQVLEEWNATTAAWPQDQCLHELVEAQARRTPDAVALIYEDQRVTYATLQASAERLAARLRALGVGPDVRVGLHLDRSPLLVVGLLGILQAGGAYVPLDPEYPAERLSYIAGDAEVAVLLTQRRYHEHWSNLALPTLYLDEEIESPDVGAAAADANARPTPAHLAYVMYTSGSTGKPKGVMIAHRSVVNNLWWRQQNYPLTPADRVLLLSSISFDVSVWDVFGPLSAGASVVLARPGAQRDSGYLVELMATQGVTAMHVVPALLRVLLEEPGLSACRSLRQVYCGADVMPVDLPARFHQRLKGAALQNQYGPTETTLYATVWDCLPGWSGARVPIGRPTGNMQAYVLDGEMQPTPIGVPGDLYLGGVGLGRGYWKRPELTAERFVPHPWRAGDRLYATGDRARWRADGILEFLGRRDHQVKIRGHRIELGEIEMVLRQHAAVQETVAVAVEGPDGERRLLAFVEAGETTGEALRAFLARQVPDYMLPEQIVLMERLPRTPTGKPDRVALASAEWRPAAVAPSGRGPQTKLEVLVAGIWRELLRLDEVGVESNFFALGGHSLLATQVVARLRQALGVELPLRRLFETPTIAGLAEYLESARPMPSALPPLRAGPRPTPLPASVTQRSLWFIQQWQPASPAYNMGLAWRLHGPLLHAALAQGLNALVARHEALRTTFAAVDGQPEQVIASQWEVPLPLDELRGASAAAVQGWIDAEARRPFDLSRDAPLRARLLQVDTDEHVVVLVLHHIAGDGWSLRLLVEEWGALVAGTTLPPLPVQYADYTLWQEHRLAERGQEHLAYWQRQLAGAPAELELPTRRVGSSPVSDAGGRHRFVVAEELTRQLEQLSHQKGATLFMALLAAFQTLLYRYSGQEDLVVGAPVAGRDLAEVEGLIGCFVNTLALRTQLNGALTFRELLGRVRETVLGALAHQETPVEQVAQALHPLRGGQPTPLFEVLFALDNEPRALLCLPGLQAEPLPVETATAKFDLALMLQEGSAGLAASLEYRTELFDAAAIARLATHLQTLLAGIVAEPDARLSQLPLLGEAERRQVVAEWNATDVSWPDDLCLHERFEAQARRTPDATALIFEQQNVPYGILNQRADRLAARLRSQGIGPDDRVGICLERSPALVVGLLAILKAGAGYVPLDPEYPQERLAFQATDADVKVLLTERRQLDRWTKLARPIYCLDDEPPASCESNGLARTATLDHLAYMLYTSGSTGKPKGVMLTHRAALNHLLYRQQHNPLHAEDRVLLVSSIGFDVSVWELFGPMLAGATVVLARPGGLRDTCYLARLLADERVTVAHFVPALLSVLLDEPALAECRFLRQINCSAETLPVDLPRRLWQVLPGRKLQNQYGPTEANVATLWDCEAAWQGRSIPIGKPIGNTQTYVLDEQLQPAPVGVPGDLYLGGASLARGYWNRPELTAERFRPNPFRAGERIYQTGDRACWLPDGNLEFLGRRDHQVKLRGYRIELGEIEAVLLQHPEVLEAVAFVAGTEPHDRRLIAAIALRNTIGIEALRDFLSGQVPEYMVPETIAVLDRLPRTPTGKPDRVALASRDWRPAQPAVRQEPRTAVEEIVAGIWKELLGLEALDMETSFFELGGHSLRATQMVARLRQTLAIQMPLRRVFETPTVRGLARFIEEARRQRPRPLLPLPPATPRQQPIPASPAQRQLWFLQQWQPASAAYNIPIAMQLKGSLNRSALEQSLNEVIRRHETLRTTFSLRDGQPVQVIQVDARLSLPVEDLGLQVWAAAAAEARRPFDLERELPLRVRLLRVGDDEHILVIVLHHIAGDGRSLTVLLHELATLSARFAEGREAPLPPLPVQYAEYALWQELTGRETAPSQLAYWKRQLQDAPPALELPIGRQRSSRPSFAGQLHRFALPAELSQSLKRLSRREGATLFMTLLAAVQTLLHRYTGLDDLLLGTPVTGRTRPESEGLIGYLVNTVVLRTSLAGNPTFRELLRRVRETVLDAMANQDLPFEQLVEALHPRRDGRHTPLFQVLFALENDAGLPQAFGGLPTSYVPVDTGWAKFDLTLFLKDRPDGLTGWFEYRSDLFDADAVARMQVHFETLLAGVANSLDTPLADLPLLPAAERQRVVVEWNQTEAEYPRDANLAALVEAQVNRQPHAIAVTGQGVSWTYAELDRRANRLAHHLRGLGVGLEDPVGLCVDRSPELVAAMLGILKAGGAYVPLDPEYPRERLVFMAGDSGMRVLVTQKHRRAALPPVAGVVVCLEDLPEAPAESPMSAATGASLAYLMYTSGSMGQPKGVAIEQRSILRLVLNTNYVDLRPEDVVAQVSNASFDAITFEVWGALLHGARIAIARRDVVLSPPEFAAFLERERVTVLFLTTALFNHLAQATPQAFRKLRYLLFGGEAVDPRWVRHVLREGPPERLLHVYGPTETTTYATFYRVESVPDDASTVPIGRPIANTEVYLLDANRQPVPIGVPGEICIGGDGLARGYHGQPEQTAERFVPHPFQPGARLYRTGDRARFGSDGNLEFLGRTDRQVKLRGFRVELSEVEAMILRHPSVRQAVVVLHEDPQAGKALTAYMVTEPGQALAASGLREFLKERLPPHMVPAHIVSLADLPLTANGKVDTRRLPASGAAPHLTNGKAEPLTAIEEQLRQIWENALNVRPIRRSDDFFDLGGNSLLAVKVFAEIHQRLGVQLPLATVFEGATIAHLARRIEPGRQPHGWSCLVPLQPKGTRPPFFCVHGIGGEVLCLAKLASCMDRDQPFFGIQARGQEGIYEPLRSVAEMAASYVAEIRAVQPCGPYFLGGFSYGGTIAYEMAQQLVADGETVALLAILENAPPRRYGPKPSWNSRTLAGFARNACYWILDDLLASPPREMMGRAFRKLRSLRPRRSANGRSGPSPDPASGLAKIFDLERLPASYRHFLETQYVAFHQYVPRPYPGRILVFKARTQPLLHLHAPDNGWGKLAGSGVDVIDIPGSHESLLRRPHVRVLAARLQQCLRRAQAPNDAK